MSTIDFAQVTTAQDLTEAARVAAAAKLAGIRSRRTCASVTLTGGLRIPRDNATRLALYGAVSALQQGMITAPVAWKILAGFDVPAALEAVVAE